MKQPIAIVLYEGDGQIDIEVYGWDEEENKKTKLLEDETEYGLIEKDEANARIDALHEQFDVMKITSLEEEEEEKSSRPPLPILTPHYFTYELTQDGFSDYINQWFYQEYGVDVPFYFYSPTESDGQTELYLYVDEDDLTEMAIRELERTTNFQVGEYYNFASELFQRIIKEPVFNYRYDPYRDVVIINVPIKK